MPRGVGPDVDLSGEVGDFVVGFAFFVVRPLMLLGISPLPQSLGGAVADQAASLGWVTELHGGRPALAGRHLPRNDQKTQIGTISLVFAQEGCLEKETQPGNLLNSGGGETARTGGPVLQRGTDVAGWSIGHKGAANFFHSRGMTILKRRKWLKRERSGLEQ